MDIRHIEIPKIENDIQFELLTRDLFNIDSNYANVNLHGRSGQKQDGVDVYARKISNPNSNWTGVQCKVRSTNRSFTKKELQDEVDNALKFNPSLSEYYLFTTLSRDATTQNFVREINDSLSQENGFTFEVLFWEDISEKLKEEENYDVYFRHYHKYFADNKVLGHSIGKLLNLELQFDEEPDTHLELIVGKIPSYGNDKYNVNYYRNTYYIVNLHDKKLEFFGKSADGKVRCYPSDIELAFENRIDCYRVTKWLKQIQNIDDFIYDENSDYKFSITDEERHQYFADRDEE